MRWLVGMVTLLTLSVPSLAYGQGLITKEVGFEAYHVGSFRTADFPDSESLNRKGVAFTLDLSVGEYVKWKNRVWTNGNDSKLHTVGWEYDIEVPIYGGVSLFHYHHSQHSMDQPTLASRFPLRNYYGLRFTFVPETR